MSVSPYRAVVKVAPLDDSESDFDRDEELPELRRSRVSPIKDDSEILRTQKSEFLGTFNNSRKKGVFTTRSERPPSIDMGEKPKGIIANHSRDNSPINF
jgi:hypothetical protein